MDIIHFRIYAAYQGVMQFSLKHFKVSNITNPNPLLFEIPTKESSQIWLILGSAFSVWLFPCTADFGSFSENE